MFSLFLLILSQNLFFDAESKPPNQEEQSLSFLLWQNKLKYLHVCLNS